MLSFFLSPGSYLIGDIAWLPPQLQRPTPPVERVQQGWYLQPSAYVYVRNTATRLLVHCQPELGPANLTAYPRLAFKGGGGAKAKQGGERNILYFGEGTTPISIITDCVNGGGAEQVASSNANQNITLTLAYGFLKNCLVSDHTAARSIPLSAAQR